MTNERRRDTTLPIVGDTVHILWPALEGKEAMVRQVYKDLRTISVALAPGQLSPDEKAFYTMHPGTKMYHFILGDGDYEVILSKRIIH